MVKLHDARKVKTISLPSYPESKVEIFDTLMTKELRKVYSLKGLNEFEVGLEVLKLKIKSWNFTDDDGKPLEISDQTLDMLSETDLKFLTDNVVGDTIEDSKKAIGSNEK